MAKFNIRKSTFIQESLDNAYSGVRDFSQWKYWSPWLIAEPDCRIDLAEDGSRYAWDGRVVGSGEMAVVDETKPRAIHYRLTFLKPWKSVSRVSFLFDERNDGVEAVWTMEGSLPFFLFWMKRMMTAYIGKDYERGLSMLKDYLERGSVPSKLEFTGARSFAGIEFVGLRRRCSIEEIGPCMEKDFQKLKAWLDETEARPGGKPVSIYHSFNPVKGITEYTAGVPIQGSTRALPEGFVSGNLPPCETYVVNHTGPYRHLSNAWAAGMMRAQAKVFRLNKSIDPFEIYESDPCHVAENDLVTKVHFPLK